MTPIFEILLVEDNEGDVLLMEEAVKTCAPKVHITVAKDGETALSLIKHGTIRPTLVVLDWNMPKGCPQAILEQCRDLGVACIIFSCGGQHVDEALRLGAAGYYEKPGTLREFLKISRRIVAEFSGSLGGPEISCSPEKEQ